MITLAYLFESKLPRNEYMNKISNENILENLYEHIFNLILFNSPEDINGWKNSIKNRIKDIDKPDLRGKYKRLSYKEYFILLDKNYITTDNIEIDRIIDERLKDKSKLFSEYRSSKFSKPYKQIQDKLIKFITSISAMLATKTVTEQKIFDLIDKIFINK